MADIPPWRRLLEEPNALGWMALLVLVGAIGLGVLYWAPSTDGEFAAARFAVLEHAAR